MLLTDGVDAIEVLSVWTEVVGGATEVVGGAVDVLELGCTILLEDGGTNELSDVGGTDVVGGATEVLTTLLDGPGVLLRDGVDTIEVLSD